MSESFDDIRPYYDEEVRPVLDRLLATPDFKLSLARLSYPRLSKWFPKVIAALAGWYAKRQLQGVHNIADMQQVVRGYMENMIERTMNGLSCSGVEKLDPQKAYLFVSNHRDIAMDPALMDFVLDEHGFDTPRLAIGDNLLTMPFASDLMRLNKSFIVNRSAKGNKEKFKALKHLSAYLHHCITVDKSHVWIAQRQGRAKDGLDRTEAAVIKMFAMNKPKEQDFADYIRELHIVPVAISYEWDPLDANKAKELHAQKTEGSYVKGEHEDVINIAKGIDGNKGHVHIAFGDELTGTFNSAEELAAEIDRQIINNYIFYPSNCFAYKTLHGELPQQSVGEKKVEFEEEKFKSDAKLLTDRLRSVAPHLRPIVRAMYANPIVSLLEWQKKSDPC